MLPGVVPVAVAFAALPCFISKDFALVCIKISLCYVASFKMAPKPVAEKAEGKHGKYSGNSGGFYINFPRPHPSWPDEVAFAVITL